MATTLLAPAEDSRCRACVLFWAGATMLLVGCGTSTAPNESPNSNDPATPSDQAPTEDGRASDTPISDLIAATPGLNGGYPVTNSSSASSNS